MICSKLKALKLNNQTLSDLNVIYCGLAWRGIANTGPKSGSMANKRTIRTITKKMPTLDV